MDFEKNNWFQIIRNRILRMSDGNIVKQDLISGLMILIIIAYMGGTINFLWEMFLGDIIKFFISNILVLARNAESILNYFLGKCSWIVIDGFTDFKFKSFSDLVNIFRELLVRLLISLIPLWISGKLFNRESFRNQIISSILMIISSVILFGEYKFTISIGVLIIAITLTQFGKGNIYRFLCNLLLYVRPFTVSQDNEHSDTIIDTIKNFVQVFSCFVIPFIFSILFNLPFAICFLLVIVLIMRFGIQFQTNNPRIETLIKAVVYILVFVTVLYSSEQIKDMTSVFTVLFAIYFAVDRLFSLYDEILTVVKKDEINYYLYFDNSMDILEQKYLPNEFLIGTISEIDEIKLLGQLIIRTELGMKDSFEKLLRLIEEKRERESEDYRLLILSLEYKMQKKENEKLTITNFIENNLKDVILFDNQKVLPIEFLVLYSEELRVQKEYDLAIQYLKFSKFYSSYYYIESYNECIKNIDKAQN